MDSLVHTRDSTGRLYSTLAGPLLAALGRHTEAHKISKAERTPMAHRERTGIAQAPTSATQSAQEAP